MRTARMLASGQKAAAPKRAAAGITLVELLVTIAITAVTLPLVLQLMLEPLISQLRISSLSETEGNANLIALKARNATSVDWDAQQQQLTIDGTPYPLPENCSVTAARGGTWEVNCRSGSHNTSRHTTNKPILIHDPCGLTKAPTPTSEDLSEALHLYPNATPDPEACRQALRQ